MLNTLILYTVYDIVYCNTMLIVGTECILILAVYQVTHICSLQHCSLPGTHVHVLFTVHSFSFVSYIYRSPVIDQVLHVPVIMLPHQEKGRKGYVEE